MEVSILTTLFCINLDEVKKKWAAYMITNVINWPNVLSCSWVWCIIWLLVSCVMWVVNALVMLQYLLVSVVIAPGMYVMEHVD
ncbi:hypothetical protein P8452_75761 [Trifolium repens]|nr:hypothetical protein P8452_75761 [Trifolium repens]